MIEFRNYTPADRDAVLRLLTEGMAPADAAAKSATFDWQFVQNPHDDGRSPFLLGTNDDAIVAVEGLMPARVIRRGTRCVATWSVDTHVVTAFRRRGISRDIVARAGDSAEIVLAYGISEVMEPVFEDLGFRAGRDVAAYTLDIRTPGAMGPLKNLRGRLYRLARRRTSVEVTVGSDVDFGPEVDELWERSALTFGCTVERDAAYLNWKYRRHPLLSYCWYAARRDTQLKGLLVARPDLGMSVIVDYCGPLGDDGLMAALVNTAVDDLCNRGTQKIHCETTDPGMAAALRRNGFRQSSGAYRFRVRSNRPDDQHPSHHFFLMTGDSDNDFSTVTSTAGSTYITLPNAALSQK